MRLLTRNASSLEEKKELIEFNKSSYEMFFEEREEEFERGWICTDCYRVYAEWARQMGFAVCAANTFGAKMRGLVQHKKKCGGLAAGSFGPECPGR